MKEDQIDGLGLKPIPTARLRENIALLKTRILRKVWPGPVFVESDAASAGLHFQIQDWPRYNNVQVPAAFPDRLPSCLSGEKDS